MKEEMEPHKITPMEELPLDHKRVLSLIREGLGNAIKVNHIRSLTGLSSERIRAIGHELVVHHGYAIGSSSSHKNPGFYIPVNELEDDKAVHNLSSRRTEIQKREEALLRNIKALRKQKKAM